MCQSWWRYYYALGIYIFCRDDDTKCTAKATQGAFKTNNLNIPQWTNVS